jgi:hypothetical protein
MTVKNAGVSGILSLFVWLRAGIHLDDFVPW